jgi:hypothetical protein
MILEARGHRMLQAFLHGKLSRTQENMADLITSMFFGTLQYLPAEYFGSFVRQAKLPDGSEPLRNLPDVVAGASWLFWPWLAEEGCHGCEPDVLIDLQLANGENLVVLLEVKYLSGSDTPMRRTRNRARRGGRRRLSIQFH